MFTEFGELLGAKNALRHVAVVVAILRGQWLNV